VDNLMVCVRAIHFAATITAVGAIFFSVFIAEPTLRKAEPSARAPAVLHAQLAWMLWIGLAVSVVSGTIWFVLLSELIGHRMGVNLFSTNLFRTMLLQTGFGRDWLARLILACLLAGVLALLLRRRGSRTPVLSALAVTFAGGLVGTLVFAGHAVGARGIEGIVHPAADFVHLIAAAAWVGMLLPLALSLAALAHEDTLIDVTHAAVRRFSNFGLVVVGLLLVTGIINALYLAGSITALIGTDYGRLLLIKIALFLVMVAIAAVNRQVWAPRLVRDGSGVRDALGRLRRNAAIEAGLGAIIIVIVAVLGVTPPPALHPQTMPGMQHHSH
jgi:copper resistance protein D